MGKYRKLPVIIEATQWFPGVSVDGVTRETEYGLPCFDEFDSPQRSYWGVRTLEGVMEVSPGDYIITGVRGEKYPCKPDIFAASYEKVGD